MLALTRKKNDFCRFRESLENELEFIGLLILQNKLKPESTPVIQELHRAQILTVMATGRKIPRSFAELGKFLHFYLP